MSNGHRWSKFWWQDWQRDPGLRECSLTARGLWMEMLCLAHEGSPVGHLTINGGAATIKQIAGRAGCTEKVAGKLMAELEGNGVFSRTEAGTIYSRRMVRDYARSDEGREYVSRRWKDPAEGKDPNSPPNRSPTRDPTSPPIRDPNRDPITRTRISEAETEAEKREERKKEDSLSYFLSKGNVRASAREDDPSVTDISTARKQFREELREAGPVGELAAALGKSLRGESAQPLYHPPVRTVSEQIAAVQPEREEAPVRQWHAQDPIRSRDEQLEALGYGHLARSAL